MKCIKKLLLGVLICVLGCSQLLAAEVNNEGMSEEAFVACLDALDEESRLDQQTGVTKAQLTREKAAYYIVKLLGYEGIAKDYANSSKFKDVESYQGEINLVSELGIMSGTGTNTFSPKQILSNKSIQTIIKRLSTKMNSETKWTHVCYAISSNSQIEMIKDYKAVSFGWAELTIDAEGNGFDLSTTKGSFKLPSDFQVPIDYAKASGAETYLMVYLKSTGESTYQLLNNKEQRSKLINELITLVNGVTRDNETRGFDGLTIDFEQFKDAKIKATYVTFLKELKAALAKENKKLNVAIQPTTYFKGYDYKGIGEMADHVILMAHDYAATSLTANEQAAGICMTPVTPINEVYKCLKEATTAMSDKNKIVLQISFDSRQWQLKEDQVINASAYTPSYDKIEARLKETSTKKNYDELSQNPYATYVNEGTKNVIWYENAKSIQAKITLAKLLGIQDVSYWRLGTIRILY